MLKTFTLSLLLILLLASCTKNTVIDDSTPSSTYRPDSLQGQYLVGTGEHYTPEIIGGTAYLKYKDNKVIKRTGGLVGISYTGGVSYRYTTMIYDTVMYTDNSIVLEAKDTTDLFVTLPTRRELFVENGRLVKRIQWDNTGNGNNNDTTYYTYDTNNYIQRTEQYSYSSVLIRDFTFNAAGNLQKVATTKKQRYGSGIYYIAEELFEGYDNTHNPLKDQLCLWEDLYYRTLSVNNFNGYSYKKYNTYSTVPTEERYNRVQLTYDSNGQADFSK